MLICTVFVTVLGVVVTANAQKEIPEEGHAASSAFGPTVPSKTSPTGKAPEGMVWIPGGEFSMGSDASGEALCGLPFW